jgi:predicted protein tyrosine phosphatase
LTVGLEKEFIARRRARLPFRHHRDKIRKRFLSVLGQPPFYVIGIPDEYERDQPELIALLKERVPPLLHRPE